MSDDAPLTLDRLAKVYLKIRAHLGELTKAYETEAETIKAKQHEVALAMKDIMQATGQKSAKTDHGTIILSTKTRYVAQDWDAMKRFIIDHDAVDLAKLLGGQRRAEIRIARLDQLQGLNLDVGRHPPVAGPAALLGNQCRRALFLVGLG